MARFLLGFFFVLLLRLVFICQPPRKLLKLLKLDWKYKISNLLVSRPRSALPNEPPLHGLQPSLQSCAPEHAMRMNAMTSQNSSNPAQFTPVVSPSHHYVLPNRVVPGSGD